MRQLFVEGEEKKKYDRIIFISFITKELTFFFASNFYFQKFDISKRSVENLSFTLLFIIRISNSNIPEFLRISKQFVKKHEFFLHKNIE